MWAAALGILKSLIGPLSMWMANRSGRKSQRVEDERDAAVSELQAVDNARAADAAVADDTVRSGLQEWRESKRHLR